MKLFTIVLVLIIATGCKDKPKPRKFTGISADSLRRLEIRIDDSLNAPHGVFNPCLKVWAVRTGIYRNSYYYRSPPEPAFFGIGAEPWINGPEKMKDSCSNAKIGFEYQFTDSSSAMMLYWGNKHRADSVYSLVLRLRKISDSIFQCQHTYK